MSHREWLTSQESIPVMLHSGQTLVAAVVCRQAYGDEFCSALEAHSKSTPCFFSDVEGCA